MFISFTLENWVDVILASRDRNDAGPTAPPDGLSLMSVKYPPSGVVNFPV